MSAGLGPGIGGIFGMSQAPLSQYANAFSQQQAMADRAYYQHYTQLSAIRALDTTDPKEEDMATPNEVIPDISLTRVFKWAIVLLVAMALGRRVWDQFGEKIKDGMGKALDELK